MMSLMCHTLLCGSAGNLRSAVRQGMLHQLAQDAEGRPRVVPNLRVLLTILLDIARSLQYVPRPGADPLRHKAG